MRALIASIFPRWLGNYSVELSAEYQEYEKLCATRQSMISPITIPDQYGLFKIIQKNTQLIVYDPLAVKNISIISILATKSKGEPWERGILGILRSYEKKSVRLTPGSSVPSPQIYTGKINPDLQICLIRSYPDGSDQANNELFIVNARETTIKSVSLSRERVTTILPYDDFLIIEQEKTKTHPANATKLYTLVCIQDGKIEKTITQ